MFVCVWEPKTVEKQHVFKHFPICSLFNVSFVFCTGCPWHMLSGAEHMHSRCSHSKESWVSFHNSSCNIIHPGNCLFFRKFKMLWPLVIQVQCKQYKGVEGCHCAIKDVLTLYPAGQLFDKANQHITQLHLWRQHFRAVKLLMPVSWCLHPFFSHSNHCN